VNSATANATQFVIEVFDTATPANVYHTETVNLAVNSISATTSAATADTASQNANTTAANTVNTVSNNTTVGLDSSATVTAATADSTAGANARADSALSVVESNSVKVEVSNLSSQFAAYVAANTGGEYTISGTDAALFDINATTGEVTSKSGLDFEAATDSDTDNQYDFTITYTSGTNSYKEVVALTVSDFADDNGSTLKDVDLSTQTGAASAVDILDSALSQISSSQAKLGAIQNRLQHNIDNLSMASMLTETSRGRIVDADFARETSELSKQQILNQAATSMLAQANQSKQSVLALLQ
jgi:flagellin